jgi:uncharacterized protein YyaL (SSP411 family)
MAADAPKPNRLSGETSPYLLQHAHNPVDWYPWGEEALARAKREDRPILLSIGYAACHWCHVMERESFENGETARLMNDNFVCIKVDREERPDLDDIYMAATMAMSGHGGWPMTVFLTPEQKPFFAGTYFPPADAYGRPGFPTLLTRIAEVWQGDRDGIEKQASDLTDAVRAQLSSLAPAVVSSALIEKAREQLSQSYDARWGGFGGAPKFPPSAGLRLLLRDHARTGSERSLEMVRGTLDGMKNGGMYDHVAGGFARYSTDERWHVPHFEKMLYDNGQLARVYTEAFQVTGDPEYERVASETLDYVLREMQSPEGGFYSATDADSEGEEGKFFVFTLNELDGILEPALARAFCAYYDVTAEGNWEHSNVLWTPRPRAQVAEKLALDEATLMKRVSEARALVYEARKKRVHPLLDDKILISWNALMIGALAEGGRVFGEARYVEAAARAVADIRTRLTRKDGGLYRTARGEKAHLEAYLEDYAYLGDALLDLYEASGEQAHVDYALSLGERMLADFRDVEGGGFYQTAHQHEQLIARSRDAQDDAMPNASAIAAQLCARLSYYFDRKDFREAAEQTVQTFGLVLPRAPRAFVSMLAVVDLLESGPVELALVGARSDARTQAFERALARLYLPNRLLAHGSGAGDETLPLLAGKTAVQGAPALYVCRNFACAAPITDPTLVTRELLTTSG